MAYITIAAGDYAAGQPITTTLAQAWSTNAEEIASGDAAAPRIQAAALETDLVADEIAGFAVGAVGTYAFMVTIATVSNNPGTTTAGSNLEYAGLETNDGILTWTKIIQSGTSPSGTWRLMGYGGTSGRASLWLRIS